MSPQALLEVVRDIGGELSVNGDHIRYRLPEDHPEKERILTELRTHKPEIIRLLAARPPMCAEACYEIEPGRWIHHPWNGCKTIVPRPPKADQKAGQTCWHCAGKGVCDCISCGCYEARMEWVAGECVPCGTRKRQGETVQ